MTRITILSLGCPKNLVDSENLVKRLQSAGISYSDSPAEADVILVNTCGFIEQAKQESVEEILKLSLFKKDDPRKRLVVFGCLVQRYGEELRREIPEIDALWGVGSEEAIVDYCRSILPAGNLPKKTRARAKDSMTLYTEPYAYLKISEGCDRTCSYCVIPSIRGRFRSRPVNEIIAEAEALVRQGKKELILIGQDITGYGKDLQAAGLEDLLSALVKIEGDFRIRLLYLYPSAITDRLIRLIAGEEKVCNYIDMPLQHSEDRVLKLMKRGGSRQTVKKLVAKIRRTIPGVVLRTTFIVGFPGETEDDVRGLLEFIREIRFEHLGVFMYSKEEGTPAYSLKGQVPRRTKERRYREVMELQSSISLEKNRGFIGKTCRALIDEIDGSVAIARLATQAPEIDGVVFVDAQGRNPGEFITVRITDAYDYDLKGAIVS